MHKCSYNMHKCQNRIKSKSWGSTKDYIGNADDNKVSVKCKAVLLKGALHLVETSLSFIDPQWCISFSLNNK